MPLKGFTRIDTGCPDWIAEKAERFARWLRNQDGRKVPGSEIATIGGLNSKVHVRKMVAYLRLQGDPELSRIASDEDGYWWSDDRKECMEAVEHLRQRARQLMRAYQGVEKAFETNPNQREMGV